MIWVGRLDTGNRYQALFSMADDAGRDNVMLRYYQPNGYLYLTVNDKSAGLYNASSLLGKIVMISLRCSGGSCAWRVGDSGSWLSAAPGTAVATNPRLRVGAGAFGWMPHINNTSAMFWVYGDALTDQEIEANFDFAGSALSGRGGFTLDGYSAGPGNTPPSVSLAQPAGGPFTAPASISLSASASDSDGSVDRVDFYANGSFLGSDTTGPAYTFTWTGVDGGDLFDRRPRLR